MPATMRIEALQNAAARNSREAIERPCRDADSPPRQAVALGLNASAPLWPAPAGGLALDDIAEAARGLDDIDAELRRRRPTNTSIVLESRSKSWS